MSKNEHQANYEKMKHIAKNVNLINFLLERYPDTIAYNTGRKRYEHNDHDSLVINPRAFYWFSRDVGGDTIRFLQDFCDKDYNAAVSELCDYAGVSGVSVPTVQRVNNKYEIPEIEESNAEYVFNYLTQERKLDPDIINELMRTGDIYADRNKNAVFVNTELTVSFARGTIKVPGGNKYRNIVSKKSNEYILFMPESDVRKVFITESPIDSISLYMLLSPEKKKHSAFAAMLGLKKETVNRIVWDFPDCEIWIATDWETRGTKFYEDNYKGIYKRMICPEEYTTEKNEKGEPVIKDWNDLLCERIKRNEY